jgi:hypothetical protein
MGALRTCLIALCVCVCVVVVVVVGGAASAIGGSGGVTGTAPHRAGPSSAVCAHQRTPRPQARSVPGRGPMCLCGCL